VTTLVESTGIEQLNLDVKAGLRALDLRQPWEWCEDNVIVDNTSPMPGPWRSANSPWVKEVMEVKADRRVSFVAVKCSAQSSKTQTVLNMLLHSIDQDPGPSMYVMANKDDAQDFVRDRFDPTLKNCAPVKEKLTRETRLAYTFTTMPLYFVGAGSLGKLQGKPMKRLYLDEVRNYPKGALPTVLKRVRAFGELAQIFMISTPDRAGDAVDRAFTDGDQRTPHFPCVECASLQQIRFEQLKWDTNEITRPGGQYHFDALASTIRYECEKCGYPLKDTPTERKLLCRSTRFVRMNPNAPAHHVSFTWDALLPWWVKWRSIVEEFIHARHALRTGDVEPMKTFVNETQGRSWEDRLGVIEDFAHLEARKSDYDYADGWAEEQIRFIAADKQQSGGEHYWYVVRAFGPLGKSRLVAYGKVNSTAELEEIRRQHNVRIGNSLIDSGYKASEVYRFCQSTGWKAFKGDEVDYFLVPDKENKKSIRQIWRKGYADPAYGTKWQGKVKPIPLFQFSTSAVKDFHAEFTRGLVGEWTLPATIARDYLRQASAEVREEQTDSRGRVRYVWVQKQKDNHLNDCELMIQIAAIITKHIAAPERKQKEPTKET
jgi:hypothetical protein